MANFTPLLKIVKDFINKQLVKIPTNPPGKPKITQVQDKEKDIMNLITSASKIPQNASYADKAESHFNLFRNSAKSAYRVFGLWNTAKTMYDAALAKYNKISGDLRRAKNPPRIRRTRKPVDQKKVKELTTKLGSARILKNSAKRTLDRKQKTLFREIKILGQLAIVVISDNEGLEIGMSGT